MTLVIDGYDDYAEQLKACRKRNKVKQAELLGVNPYTLRSWEQQKAKPPYHEWRLFKEFARGNDIID